MALGWRINRMPCCMIPTPAATVEISGRLGNNMKTHNKVEGKYPLELERRCCSIRHRYAALALLRRRAHEELEKILTLTPLA